MGLPPKSAAKAKTAPVASKPVAAKPAGKVAAAKPAAKVASAKAASAGAKAPGPPPPSEEELKKIEEERTKAEAEAAEEALRKTQQDAELAKQREAAEKEIQRLAALANGEVTIKYSMYAEKFTIQNHTLTAAAIDDLYCLSDVMPGCFIHLSEKEFIHGEEHMYMKEDPPGTFLGLMAGETYWCYVQQDPEQEKRDQQMIKEKWAGVTVQGGLGDRGSEGETCSCAWGAPCTNPMICKDWDNRFANAIKGGGNPLLFTGTN